VQDGFRPSVVALVEVLLAPGRRRVCALSSWLERLDACDTLIVWRLDRLGLARDTSDLC
jgi:hypothetical protein